MQTKMYTEIDYSEFEDIVKETYGHDYEFVSDVECGNDSDHSYNVVKKKD